MTKQRSGHLAIVPAAAVFDARVGPAGLRALCAIAAHADQSGKCWPATTTLADELGVTDRQIRTHLRNLERLGYLETEPRPGQVSIYRIALNAQNPGTLPSGVNPGTSTSGVDANPGTSASAPPEHELPGTPEAELPPKDIKKDTKKDYAFSGVIIHLTESAFTTWTDSYSAITDLRAALQRRDDWLATLPASDRRRKDWYVPTSNWLARENERHLAERSRRDDDSDVIH